MADIYAAMGKVKWGRVLDDEWTYDSGEKCRVGDVINWQGEYWMVRRKNDARCGMKAYKIDDGGNLKEYHRNPSFRKASLIYGADKVSSVYEQLETFRIGIKPADGPPTPAIKSENTDPEFEDLIQRMKDLMRKRGEKKMIIILD